MFGYTGLRIELEHLTVNPHLPPNTHKLKVTGINYLEATFDLLVTEDRVLLVVRETSDKFPLQLKTKSAGTTWVLRTGYGRVFQGLIKRAVLSLLVHPLIRLKQAKIPYKMFGLIEIKLRVL